VFTVCFGKFRKPPQSFKLAQFDMPDMNKYIGCYGNLPLIHKVHILSEMGENPSTDLVAFFETMKPMPRLPCLSFPE
jgi:hypothetical protein